MSQEKFIGLINIVNPDYQIEIHTKTKEIMQNSKEVAIETLKNNSIFQEILSNNTKEEQQNFWDKVKDFAGDFVNKTELKTILILLDANLEKQKDSESEKFVMDNQFELKSTSGINRASIDEVNWLKHIASQFDFDNLKQAFFPKVSNDTVQLLDRNNQKIIEKPLKEILDME